MGVYPLGTQVTVFHTFTVKGVPTNPTTVTFTIELPDETTDIFVFGVDPELTRPATGYYELAYLPPAAGTYEYKAAGTGAVVATSPTGSFSVLSDAIAAQREGPCEPWISADDIANCCSVEVGTGATFIFDEAALQAETILFELSGRLFSGVCTKTVRPCRTRSCGCDWQVLSRGHIVWSGEFWSCRDATPCGCRGLSRIPLAGYPVRAISQVKIDGAVVSASTYRLDEQRYLTRVRDPANPNTVLRWPSCQSLDLPDSAAGTFSITYSYGQDPPEMAIRAAAQLGCEIYKSCQGLDCALPSGATRITRQGLQIERQFLRFDPDTKAWRTGMTLVDSFLNAVNPGGLRRRPAIWSPASHLQYARPVGGA